MANFYDDILKAISDYKQILRRTLSVKDCTFKLHGLGIKRGYVKGTDEIGLYELGLKIMKDLQSYLDGRDNKKNINSYFGPKEFLNHLEVIFAKYKVENGKVVNIGQKASCALVVAVQLITMPKDRINDRVVEQLTVCKDIISIYGNKDQKQFFNKAIKSNGLNLDLLAT